MRQPLLFLAPSRHCSSRRCCPPRFPAAAAFLSSNLLQPSLFVLLLLFCLFALVLFYVFWSPLFAQLPDVPTKFTPIIQQQQESDSSFSHHPSQTTTTAIDELPLSSAFGVAIWRQLSSLNCSRLLLPDPVYVERTKRERMVQRDPRRLDMNCTAVMARWQFVNEAQSEEEAKFPLAFARTVFRDYLFLEQMLSVEFAPQNLYCYSLDAKASNRFKKRIRLLAKCFPANVFVARAEYSVMSNGKNVSRSHLACMEMLLRHKHQTTAGGGEQWKYVLLLQNHDIPLRTNAELVRILRQYNGTNDIATRKVIAHSVNRTLNWSVRTLRLFRNESRIPDGLTSLRHTKSLNLIALSRRAVEFSLRELNLEPFIDQLETSRYGMDEVLFSTLNSNLPNFPGGFTTQCLFNHDRMVNSMGRYTIWRTYGTVTDQCKSNYFRHDLCIYGVEDLEHIGRARLHFYLNKMMPSYDFGAIFCWLSALETRRQERELNVNEHYYQQLSHVRFNRQRADGGQMDTFDC